MSISSGDDEWEGGDILPVETCWDKGEMISSYTGPGLYIDKQTDGWVNRQTDDLFIFFFIFSSLLFPGGGL